MDERTNYYIVDFEIKAEIMNNECTVIPSNNFYYRFFKLAPTDLFVFYRKSLTHIVSVDYI